MVAEVVLGCCEYGNQSAFELMQSYYAEHVRAVSRESDFVEAAFQTAIDNNQTAIIKTLIRKLNLQNQHRSIDFNRMFIKAAEKGLKEIVESLIDFAVVVNVRDEKGWTALHFASLQGNIELVKLLHRRGGEINGCTFDGLSPLHLAVRGSLIALMRILRSRGANVHLLRRDGKSLLHTAVETGNHEVVREVISYGVRKNLKTNTKGQTALHLAAASGHCDIITMWKQRFNFMLDRDKDGNTPLHLIVETGSLRAVKSVESALNMFSAHIRNQAGFALIHTAVHRGYKDILELLLKHGCSVDFKGPNSLTALHLAVIGNHKQIFKCVLQNKASVNKTCGSGYAPIHYAAEKTDDYFVRALLRYGADINMRRSHRDSKGETALHIAATNGLKQNVLTLIGQEQTI
ncbi:putative ankyrin repeat protein RF_0381 [Haliotis rubra]|uniref:putative ankyrin repeat protein RF_0381 n=1 Tax=Haliotis rubra TaxID=36100 RepID=UPI001EE55609|nr:putative ankyrin repeat protein RF_0381 [Haliotis rubra]